MKHVFLIAGVAVLAFAVYKHHRPAPVLAQEGHANDARQLSAGMDNTSSPALNDLPSPAPAGGAPLSPSASIAPAPAPATNRQVHAEPGTTSKTFFSPLEL